MKWSPFAPLFLSVCLMLHFSPPWVLSVHVCLFYFPRQSRHMLIRYIYMILVFVSRLLVLSYMNIEYCHMYQWPRCYANHSGYAIRLICPIVIKHWFFPREPLPTNEPLVWFAKIGTVGEKSSWTTLTTLHAPKLFQLEFWSTFQWIWLKSRYFIKALLY